MSEPNFLDKVKSVIKDTAKYLADGAKNVPEEEYLRRAKICDSCVHFVRKKNACGICGCYMHVKAKWKISECPKEKW
tara:strand:- start:2017 stop:2247 length:231 start_codon:yes stop_codon:yes gene_type:complete